MLTITILPEVTAIFLLMFARMGALVMMLPGLGERSVPIRIRLVLALAIAVLFYPAVAPQYPAGLTQDTARLVWLLITEVIIGLALGLLARLLMSVAQIAGSAIAYQMGLGFSQSVDPTMGQQGAIIGTFLSVTAITFVFVLDLHHLGIAGLAGSYTLFAPGDALPAGDFAALAVATVADAFRVAIQIAAPFLVFGLIFSLGLGILSRLMPQLQVFFVAMPATILIGFILIALLIGAIMTGFMGHVRDGLMRLLGA